MAFRKQPLAAMITASVLALTLTACGSGGAGSDASPTGDGSDPGVQPYTYDFTQPTVQSDQQIVVEVNQDLLDVDGDYATSRHIERVTVRPLELDSTEWCAMTWDYELLGDPITARYEELKKNNIDWMTADISDDQWREIALDLEPQLTEADLKQIVAGNHPMFSHEKLRQHAASSKPMRSDQELRQSVVEHTLSVTTAELGEPDLDDPSRGFYYSEENNVATVIDRCAASVNVDETDFEIAFTSGDGSLGEVPIGVMRDGTVFATEGEVNGWQLDANGDWITK